VCFLRVDGFWRRIDLLRQFYFNDPAGLGYLFVQISRINHAQRSPRSRYGPIGSRRLIGNEHRPLGADGRMLPFSRKGYGHIETFFHPLRIKGIR
jgi:hypothetical protein